MSTYDKFEKEFLDNWDKYDKFGAELDKWRGKVLDEQDVLEVNKILEEMQQLFVDKLWDPLNFAKNNYQFCCKALHQHQVLIDQLKANGATPIEAQS